MTEARDQALLSDATVHELKDSLTTKLKVVEEQLHERLDSRLNSQFAQMLIQLGESLSSTFASYSKKICDAIHESQLQNLQETNGIVDYHERFVSICSRGTFSEAYLVGVYLDGLQPEMQMKVRMLKPQNIRQCLSFGKLYEYAYPRLPQKLNGNRTNLVSRSMEDAANHKKGMSDVIAVRSQDSREAFHELEQDLKTQPDINCAGVETESITFSLNWCASQAAFGVPQRDEFPSPAQEDISPLFIEHLQPPLVATVEVFGVLQQDEIPIPVQEESAKFSLSKVLLCADETVSVVPTLNEVSPFLEFISLFQARFQRTSLPSLQFKLQMAMDMILLCIC